MLNSLFTDPRKQAKGDGSVDNGTKCIPIHGHSRRFSGPLSAIDGYGGSTVMVKKVPLTLKIGRSPL